jgi:hypothetical protein
MTVRRSSIISLCAAMVALAAAGAGGSAVAQTNAVKLVKGTITDAKTGKPIDGGKVNVYAGSAAETEAYSKINPRTGFYQLILKPNTEYRFEVVSPRFYTTNITVRTSAGAAYEESVKDLKVEPIPMGTVVYTGRLFEPGSSTLSDAAALRTVADMMKKQPAVAVTVTVVPELAAKKAAPAAKKSKKGKKGGAAAAEAVPVVAVDPTATLGDARMTALKNYFKSQGISTTRLAWDVRPVISAPAGRGKGPDNVVVKITSIQDENDG